MVRMLYLLLFFAVSAWAEEYTALNFYGQAIPLHLIEKQECLNRVADFVQAEGTIARGLIALTAPTGGSANCLRELWASDHDVLKAITTPVAPPPFGAEPNYPPEKMEELSSWSARARCVNPNSPGTPEYESYKSVYASTCAAWYTGAQGKYFTERFAEGKRARDEWLAAVHARYELARAIAELMAPAPAPEQKKREEFNLRLDCYNPNDPGTPNYQLFLEKHEERCRGHWQTKDQWVEASAGFRALSQREERREASWREAYYPTVTYVAEKLDRGVGNKDRLAAIKAASDCFPRGEPGSEKYEQAALRLKESCPAGLTSPETMAAVTAEVKALFPNAAAEQPAVLAEISRQRSEHPLRLAEVVRKKGTLYDDLRFLAKFTHFLEHGGTPAHAESFCQEYEDLQRRDLKMKAAGLELFAYDSDQDWHNAFEFGLSEGEFSAIREYSRNLYTEINPALRSREPLPKKLEMYREVLDRALSRLPDYAGPPVMRTDNLPPEVLADHRKGALVRYDAYTSTSATADWLDDHNNYSQKFLIYLGPGHKFIGDFSQFPVEREVLVRHGARFKVIERRESPTGLKFVLGEVDERGNLLVKVPGEPSP